MTKDFWANLALCVFLGIVAIFGVAKIGSALTPKGLLVGEPRPSAEAAPLLPDVQLTGYQLGETLDRVVEADFEIRNNSGHDIRNIRILCEFYDADNNYVDRKWWLLNEVVPAGGEVAISRAQRRYVNTRSHTLNCEIADLQPVSEPFFTVHRVEPKGHDGGQGGEAGGH
ncbi:MAG: FxLYD domain-containing protein [Desulfobulbaceae bacterium]